MFFFQNFIFLNKINKIVRMLTVFSKKFCFQNMYLRVTTATSNINFHRNHAKNVRFVGVFSLFIFFQKSFKKARDGVFLRRFEENHQIYANFIQKIDHRVGCDH